MNKESLVKTTKNVLRGIDTIVVKPRDSELSSKLKENFVHNERSFIYGHIKRLIDCLYCHAAPGTLEMTLEELTKSIPKAKGCRLLNLGGGTGQVPAILSSLGYEVFNLDLDVKAKDVTDHNISYDLNSSSTIPVEKNSFDVVLCQEIIEHLENPWKLFRNAHESLRADGILIISTPNVQSAYSRLRFYLTGYLKWFSLGCFTYHINPLFDWEIRLIAEKTGFKLDKLRGSGDFFFDRNNQTERKILSRDEELIYFFTKKN